jgi:hypothetical protein
VPHELTHLASHDTALFSLAGQLAERVLHGALIIPTVLTCPEFGSRIGVLPNTSTFIFHLLKLLTPHT